MTDINEVYESKWLKAEHLGERPHKVTIEAITVEKFTDAHGNGKNQLVLKFVGKNPRLGLNQTNAKTIAGVLRSTDYSKWVGRDITIFATETDFGGKTVPCIRVSKKKPPLAVPHDDEDDDGVGDASYNPDDDIPF